MEFDYRQSAGFLTNHAARLFAAGLQNRLKPLGLSLGVFPVLLLLWEQDGQTQSALVQKLAIEQATMAMTLKRMERDDLVHREPHCHDRRQSLFFLTERAKALEQPAKAAAQAQNMRALAALSAEEQRLYRRLLTRVIATMAEKDGNNRR